MPNSNSNFNSGCPTLAATLFLRLGWDQPNSFPTPLAPLTPLATLHSAIFRARRNLRISPGTSVALRLKWILRGVLSRRLKVPARQSTLAAFVSRSGFLWSWRRDLNPRPSDYKSDALPAELRQLFTHPETRPEADSCADTLQLSAYTAQNTRLAHQRTASKRPSDSKNVAVNPRKQRNPAAARGTPTQCKSGCPTCLTLQSCIAESSRHHGSF